MTINTVSSSNAAAAVRAQQQHTGAKHKPAVDFSKLMASAGGEVKNDIPSPANPAGATTAIAQGGNSVKATV